MVKNGNGNGDAVRTDPGGEDVGRIVTPLVIRNRHDERLAREGAIPANAVRTVEVADALVDTGASTLCLPPSLIAALGLTPDERRTVRTAAGLREATVYSEVLATIQDRNAVVRVLEVPEGTPVLVGQIPLEEMDLVLYPLGGKLIPNPAHGGQWSLEIY
jgi:predicted aspartyl protease